MRITRVALSFFTVGFLAGTFEQAAGLGDAQRGQRPSFQVVEAASASAVDPAPSLATPLLSKVPLPVVDSDRQGGSDRDLASPANAPDREGDREGDANRETPLQAGAGHRLRDMGDGRAAEAVGAPFARSAAEDAVRLEG